MHRIFISSVQKELAAERRALKDYIQGDPLLRRFFEVFLFEDLPASDRRADEVYLAEVDRCAIYLGLFGREYGFEDPDGVSPTEREFVRATERGKERLVFVIGSDDAGRDPKMLNLIRQAGEQVVRRRVRTTPELIAAVYASFVEYLERHGELRTRPFDASACQDATLDDISDKHVRWFLTQARERQYPLADSTPVADVLTHLSLLDKNRPTNAAILLFGQTRFIGVGLLLLFVAGFAQSFCLTPLAAAMLRSSSGAMRGRVMGIRMLAIWGLPLGLLAAGPIIARFGYAASTLLYASLGLAATIAIGYRWRHALWHRSAVANSNL